MKTTIFPDEDGIPLVSIEGSESPESVAKEYLKVAKILDESLASDKKEKKEKED